MKNIKTFLFIFLCFLASMNTMADVTIDNIKYSLNQNSRTATVTGSSLENVVIPETILYDDITYQVTEIGEGAFKSNNTTKTVKCGNTIKNIGYEAFYYASNLEKIDIGKNVTFISSYAFYACSKLKYIVLPQTIKSIGNSGTFTSCPASIICLRQSFNTQPYSSQTIKPSSFYTFSNNSFDYNGTVPVVNYTFNGIGHGFQPTSVSMDALEATADTHTSYLHCTFTNEDMSFDVDIPYQYTINPVTLTATVKDAQRLYGDANPEFTSTYTGFVNGENASVITSQGTYTTSATAKSNVGTYSIIQSGAQAQNYVFAYEDGTLTVNKAPLTMTANDKTMTYGDNVPTLNATYSGLKNNETQPIWITTPQITTTGTKTSKVGTYPITISGAEAKNYTLTINNGTLTIEKAALTVRADNKSRLYGDSNPAFTLTYSGLKNNETVPEWVTAPVVATTATEKSDVGTYPITISNAVAVNYDITPTDGQLTINKASLIIKPKDVTRLYGEENPTFELLYSGLKNNETEPAWITAPVITTSATKTSNVGSYTISISSTVAAKNYAIQRTNGTLTINKAPLVVSVKDCSRKYGEQNPTFGLNYEGMKNDETAPTWTQYPTITTEATSKSDVGEYAITATGGMMKNYETDAITPGVLSITQASLLIKAKNASRLYFEENPTFSYTCQGFLSGEDESVLTKKPTLNTTAKKNSPAGVYPIEISGAKAKNYSIAYENGELTINKRNLTVSTKDYTRAYGEANPVFELTYTGFVNNENENVLISKPKAMTEATESTDVGIYNITVGDGVAENYNFNYIGGKLTIEKAYQTLTWDQDFSGVKQFDQVELTAEASSGLEITYTVEGSQICSITKIGKKQYLDCTGVGETVIMAVQKGNKNYWETTKIYKTIIIRSASGIVSIANVIDENTQIYDVSGNQLNTLQKGINIIRMSDGTTKKVVVK